MRGDSVAAVWPTLEIIRDIYTQASQGVTLTWVSLWDAYAAPAALSVRESRFRHQLGRPGEGLAVQPRRPQSAGIRRPAGSAQQLHRPRGRRFRGARHGRPRGRGKAGCCGVCGRAAGEDPVARDGGGRPDVRRAVTGHLLSMVGRALVRRGELVTVLDVSALDGAVTLAPAGTWDVRGGWRPDSWRYRCDLFGPSGNITRLLPRPVSVTSGGMWTRCDHGMGSRRPPWRARRRPRPGRLSTP